MPSHEYLLECVSMQQHSETLPRRVDQPRLASSASADSFCMIPYDRREGMPVEEAAEIAGRDVRTLRRWCVERDIGRRIAGGPWTVSRIALAMLLNDDAVALAAYLSGDRISAHVRSYFETAGLADLPRRWAGIGSAPQVAVTDIADIVT